VVATARETRSVRVALADTVCQLGFVGESLAMTFFLTPFQAMGLRVAQARL